MLVWNSPKTLSMEVEHYSWSISCVSLVGGGVGFWKTIRQVRKRKDRGGGGSPFPELPELPSAHVSGLPPSIWPLWYQWWRSPPIMQHAQHHEMRAGITWRRNSCYCHLIDEEHEAQRGQVIFLRSHSKWESHTPAAGLCDSKAHTPHFCAGDLSQVMWQWMQTGTLLAGWQVWPDHIQPFFIMPSHTVRWSRHPWHSVGCPKWNVKDNAQWALDLRPNVLKKSPTYKNIIHFLFNFF